MIKAEKEYMEWRLRNQEELYKLHWPYKECLGFDGFCMYIFYGLNKEMPNGKKIDKQ